MTQVQVEDPGLGVSLVASVTANPFHHEDAWWEDEYGGPMYEEKGKGVGLGTEEEDDSLTFDDLFNNLDDVEWKQYDPPVGLQWIAEADPDEVVRVIRDSVNRVRERIAQEQEEELRRVQEAAAELARLEIEQQQQVQQGQTVAADTVITTEQRAPTEPEDVCMKRAAPLPRTSTHRQPYVMPKRSLRKDIPAEIRSILSPDTGAKPKSKRNRSIFSLLWKSHGPDRPETSAAGAARSLLYRTDDVVLDPTLSARPEVKQKVEPVQVECVSCLDDFDSRDMIKAPCHHYCVDCFERLIGTACENEQQWPAKCCLNQIPDETITTVIRGELLEKWRNKGWEWGLPVSDRIYCSEANCSVWCRPHEINRAQNIATCRNRHRTCIICRGAEHGREACPQDRDLAQTNELAEEEGWKRCYGCNAFVEHREACQHMTCRCGAEFCYVCSARWRTCHCTMEQLAAVKAEADRRRMQREVREAEKEAELQEILRQIEEYEREIALKTELLRQEQERIAEERRQKELEQRIQREQARRQEVAIKFSGLREAFERLHDIQRSMVHDMHTQEDEQLTTDNAAKMEDLKERHAQERENLLATVEDKIKLQEAHVESEYAARLSDERQLEAQYTSQLKLYWAGKPNGQEQLESSLKDFQIKMDRGFKAWRKWMDTELATYSWQMREEQTIQSELMANAERRLHEANRATMTAYMQRRAGQLRWVDVVVKERAIMLREMEHAEIHNGGEDIDAWFAEATLSEESVAAATGAPFGSNPESDVARIADNDDEIGVALSPGAN
ncbi:uncharacterized protein B0I36DRAFT_318018 [Microdochium trichocladiopsis]|uniref:RBR-type E3 ubiquitin transferase n=1 Tax=Microdochium trichocladiopsis TaxID=1682393 RepID=A0A9P9BQV2_9PEZI|nr:uncharacterized protein B0I36DRAFT_318018 [Microdochium trichocladiopsis]KAH7035278.1 hypothetical protein B0I36DRAFT_318018 [Microdochium trichocladiopsis]